MGTNIGANFHFCSIFIPVHCFWAILKYSLNFSKFDFLLFTVQDSNSATFYRKNNHKSFALNSLFCITFFHFKVSNIYGKFFLFLQIICYLTFNFFSLFITPKFFDIGSQLGFFLPQSIKLTCVLKVD